MVASLVALTTPKLPALHFLRGSRVLQLFSGEMGNEKSLLGDTCKDLRLFSEGGGVKDTSATGIADLDWCIVGTLPLVKTLLSYQHLRQIMSGVWPWRWSAVQRKNPCLDI